MGAKRKVDTKLYVKIKKELKSPKDDAKAIKKYKLGQATIRAIRNSWCYDDYISRTTKKKHAKCAKFSTQEKAFMSWYGFLAFAVIGALAVLYMIVRWILSWFGA